MDKSLPLWKRWFARLPKGELEADDWQTRPELPSLWESGLASFPKTLNSSSTWEVLSITDGALPSCEHL